MAYKVPLMLMCPSFPFLPITQPLSAYTLSIWNCLLLFINQIYVALPWHCVNCFSTRVLLLLSQLDKLLHILQNPAQILPSLWTPLWVSLLCAPIFCIYLYNCTYLMRSGSRLTEWRAARALELSRHRVKSWLCHVSFNQIAFYRMNYMKHAEPCSRNTKMTNLCSPWKKLVLMQSGCRFRQ